MPRLRLDPHTRATPFRRGAPLLYFALFFSVVCAPPAQAGFIGDYALSEFTLVNNNGDGTALVSPDGSTLTLTGPNNGSGLPGTTSLITVAKGTGLVQFDFSYATLDIWFPGDPGAPYDFAGYLIGAAFVELANQDGQSGTASFMVTLGDTFGFRVASVDNLGEPGILTVSNFTAPGGGAAIPEPGTSSLLLLAGGATLAVARLRRTGARKEKHS